MHTHQRQWEIDALRGLMLVLMTVTHLPTRLSESIGQPFGHVSAAEGFVLLSGYLAGMVYGRLALERGMGCARRAMWHRAFLIYGSHLALLLFLFTVIAFNGLARNQPAVTDLMSYYLRHPGDALVGGWLLIYQPPLLDILPMYVFFMLLSPWVLAAALQHGWGRVLGVSAVIWFLAQFDGTERLYHAVASLTGIPVPYDATGAFHAFAWQLLWVSGLWMGVSRHQQLRPTPIAVPPVAVAAASVVAVIGFTWRHAVGQVPFGPDSPLNLLFDKWHLGPLRLLNMLALIILLVRFGPWLRAHLPRLRMLETLGAAGLPVFCAHVVLVLTVLSLAGARYDRPWSVDLPLFGCALLALYGAGRLALWLEHKPPRPAGVSG